MYIEYKKYKYVMIYTGSDIFVMTRISKTIIFGLKVVIQEVVITSVFRLSGRFLPSYNNLTQPAELQIIPSTL